MPHVACRDGEPGDGGGGPLHEQVDRGAARRVRTVGRVQAGDRQRRNGAGVLADHVERLAACREQGDAGGLRDDRLDEYRAGVDEMLAGIEDQQQVAVTQVGEHGVPLLASRPLGEAEGVRDQVGKVLGFAQRGQLDQAHPVDEHRTAPPARAPVRAPAPG